jgi:hypothetical protein
MGDTGPAELLRLMIFESTPTKRDQLRWAVEKRELIARGVPPAECLLMIGRRQYGPTFDGTGRNALLKAVTGNAGSEITRAADLIYAQLDDDGKAAVWPDPL